MRAARMRTVASKNSDCPWLAQCPAVQGPAAAEAVATRLATSVVARALVQGADAE
jgi:hypothetical protein